MNKKHRKRMQHLLGTGEHFIPVRMKTVIPKSDEDALKKLEREPWATKRYQELREQKTIADAWNEMWSTLELTTSDIEDILMAFIGVAESKTMILSQDEAMVYEKIRSFHYDAFPEAETYILTKIAKQEEHAQ